jgi:pimeloyl-ACP methyl ester carboxylesterase/uncharacterized protein YjiS (DUF1127 family)
MSTISPAATRQGSITSGTISTLVRVLKTSWTAFIDWRNNFTALAELGTMSDYELKDIGLLRSDIRRSTVVEERRIALSDSVAEGSQLRKRTATDVDSMTRARAGAPGRVIAFHCSGAGAGQWRSLANALGSQFKLEAPEHYGCESIGMWPGAHGFTIGDEAAKAIALIDRCEEKVHLVGHSYGGGVALHVALVRHERIASLALYEPSVFYLLPHMGKAGREAHAEIVKVAQRICEGVETGDYRGGAAAFVDYWNGAGAWGAMSPALQDALIRWLPKAPLDFNALLQEPTLPNDYRRLSFPVLILRGEHAPAPTRLLADGLSNYLPESRLTVIEGAGHMGPVTHAAAVSVPIVDHIVASEIEAKIHQQRWCPRKLSEILSATGRSAKAVS